MRSAQRQVCCKVVLFVCALLGGLASAQSGQFVNWESPTVHPLDITPDAARLLAVNLADNRLEVFDIAGGVPVPIGSAPVGMDPVSVRARTSVEAWVVNHISDSVSVVDLTTLHVRRTLAAGDAPGDVVFAAGRAFVSASGDNAVRVFNLSDLDAAPIVLPIQGEGPRALATDGVRVYAAIFESGNKTTILSEQQVSTPSLNPYPGDPNPPPNAGTAFDPPIAPGLPAPPRAGLIVKKMGQAWRDDNNGNWSSAVSWDLHDHDVAIIDAASLGVSYAGGLMNANMALAVGPAGRVTVVGTDALNHVRFEQHVRGRFLRVNIASFDPASPASPSILDLNPHLSYASSSVPQALRELSVGDPRAVVWSADGTRGYVAGMGSNNVVVLDSSLVRVDLIETGEGPAGLALDEARSRLYVLNRFEASIDTIDTRTNTNLGFVPFFDPTPDAIRAGRPHLYNTRRTSGLGHASCASCHIDARMDGLAWDLGNPQGQVKPFNQVCNLGVAGGCEDWHPMKGPMVTQTLVGITGTEPLHWRGDRETLAEFNQAFVGLLGADGPLSDVEMAELAAFVATLTPPPNPFRDFTGSLRTSLPNGGDAVRGYDLYATAPIDGGVAACIVCHALPTGTNGTITSANLINEPQSMKIPHLLNMHDKTGFSKTSLSNNRGFGFTHDGAIDTLMNFLRLPVFRFPAGAAGEQQRRDLEAFLLSFSFDTHPGVGVQTTLADIRSAGGQQVALLNQMISLADAGKFALVAKGFIAGLPRGYTYIGGGMWQSDRAGETVSDSSLRASATPGGEITFTVVPNGTRIRIGIDRDLDGYYDRDELDAGSDPADPNSVPPPPPCPGDADGNGAVDFGDITSVLANWNASYVPSTGPGDANHDGAVDFGDVTEVLVRWGSACE